MTTQSAIERAMQELASADAAMRLGIPPETCIPALERAIALLRDSLNNFNVEIDDEDTNITLRDGKDELIMWTSDEWKEDPSLVAVIVNAVCIGYTDGPNEIRKRIGTR